MLELVGQNEITQVGKENESYRKGLIQEVMEPAETILSHIENFSDAQKLTHTYSERQEQSS